MELAKTLPLELRNENPPGIWRLIDGRLPKAGLWAAAHLLRQCGIIHGVTYA